MIILRKLIKTCFLLFENNFIMKIDLLSFNNFGEERIIFSVSKSLFVQ